MSSPHDYYQVLGVAKNASKDEIKSSYRRLALQYHPDRNKNDKAAEEKFKEVTRAYEVLIDDEKRAAYDRYGPEGVNASAGFGEGFGGFSDVFSDIFEDFFGTGARRSAQRASRGQNLGAEVAISFTEAAFGAEKSITIRREEPCRQCRGDGAQPGTQRETCRTCRGAGQVSVSSGFFSIARGCAACKGRGSVIQKPCAGCRGSGHETVSHKISVKIPAGVDTGARLRVAGEGEAGRRGGSRGDLYVDIFVEPHDIFKRHGADILCEVPIGFVQATLGAECDVPTLAGVEKLKIPAGTQTGRVFRLKGKGVPHLGREGRGDMHMRVVVETPTGLNSRQKEFLMKFAQEAGEKVNPISGSFMEKVKAVIDGIKK